MSCFRNLSFPTWLGSIRRPVLSLLCLSMIVAMGIPSPAAGQASCGPQDEDQRMSDHRLLRQLSLDLLGRIPTMDEWDRLEGGARIEVTLIPEMLESEAYFAQVREQHRALLWARLKDGDDLSVRGLGPVPGTDRWHLSRNRRAYRGYSGLYCLDEPQPADAYDRDGRPLPIRVTRGAAAAAMGCDPADGERGDEPAECRQEGWVEVVPYWDLDSTIKVCAYGAQEFLVGSDGSSCEVINQDPWCGCGPNVQWCTTPGVHFDDARGRVRRALENEAPRVFEAIVRENRPYHEAFTTRETWVNGASAHFYAHQVGKRDEHDGNQIFGDIQFNEVPDMAFLDENWVRVQRGEVHSGVLTSALYLLRLTSNRARANHFFTTFRCEPFVPPAEGLPPDTSAVPNPNLRQREGCASCHARLEPLAAHWGRWRTRGTYGYLDETFMSLSAVDDVCVGCGGEGHRPCAKYCDAYFVTRTNSAGGTLEDWVGRPLTRIYLEDAEAPVIDLGPGMLADEPLERDRIAACTVRTAAQRLLGRELTQREALGWAAELTADHIASAYNYTELLHAIVLSERYQTIR